MKRNHESSIAGTVVLFAKELLHGLTLALSESPAGSPIGRLPFEGARGLAFAPAGRIGRLAIDRPVVRKVVRGGLREAVRPSSLLPAA